MWEQTLSGLIKALRSKKDQEKEIINQSLKEINQEVKSTDLQLKSNAILKLSYLDMLGYPQLSNHSFNVIECMSSNVFQFKQIGYMAAAQSFGPYTEVSMLTTNLVKKDLVSHSSSNQVKSFFNQLSSSSSSSASQIPSTPPILSVTLAALPHLLTTQNYIDLSPDLIKLLNHSKPSIRSRAIIMVNTLAKLDLQRVTEEESISLQTRHPELDRHMSSWVERLRPRLFDDDFSVIQVTVNVICELVTLYPWPWLEIAADLYDLLESNETNWLRIKIVKLFTALMPIEPRLTRKLLPNLTSIIHKSSAMSLLNECIHTILAGGLIKEAQLAQTCIEKLLEFLNAVDPNLRYISLIGLRKLIEFHPHLLQSQLNLILDLVADPDPSISSKALDLIQENEYDVGSTVETIESLIEHLVEEKPKTMDAMSSLLSIQQSQPIVKLKTDQEVMDHKIRIAQIIILIGSYETYSNVRDFEWFIDILIQLSILLPKSLTHSDIGISETLIDICSRVIGIRQYTVQEMLKVLKSEDLFTSYSSIIKAAIWIVGEYSVSARESVDEREVIGTLFKAELMDPNSPQIAMVALENGVKVFVRFVKSLGIRHDTLEEVHELMEAILGRFDGLVSDTNGNGNGSNGLMRIEMCEMLERVKELKSLVGFLKSQLPKTMEPPKERKVEEGHGYEVERNPFMNQEDEETEEKKGEGDGFDEVFGLFDLYELRPVARLAQGMVIAPDELELESWKPYLSLDDQSKLGEEGVDEYGRRIRGEEGLLDLVMGDEGGKKKKKKKGIKGKENNEPKMKKQDYLKNQGDPYYLDEDDKEEEEEINVDEIPIVKLDLSDLGLESIGSSNPLEEKEKKKKKIRKKVMGSKSSEMVVVDRVGEMPDLSYLNGKDQRLSLQHEEIKVEVGGGSEMVGKDGKRHEEAEEEVVKEEGKVEKKVVKVKPKVVVKKSKKKAIKMKKDEGG